MRIRDAATCPSEYVHASATICDAPSPPLPLPLNFTSSNDTPPTRARLLWNAPGSSPTSHSNRTTGAINQLRTEWCNGGYGDWDAHLFAGKAEGQGQHPETR